MNKNIERKKKRRLKIGPVIFLFLIVIFGVFIYCILDIYNSLKSNTEEIKIVNTIDNYNYSLNESDPAYVSELFYKLKDVLEDTDIDEEEYATLVSQIFLADFYTLNSAISRNDIGGVQYVLESYQDTFTKKAKDTVYKYVESNIYGNRTQDLPIVKNVKVTDISKKTYESSNIEDSDAYYITCEIEYKEDLDYQTYANLILVHNNNKLEIAVMK
jgi:hypothetical protein